MFGSSENMKNEMVEYLDLVTSNSIMRFNFGEIADSQNLTHAIEYQ